MNRDREFFRQRLLQIINEKEAQTIVNEECRKYVTSVIVKEYPSLADKFKLIIENMSVPMFANVSYKDDSIFLKGGVVLTFSVIGTLICDYTFKMPVIGTILGFSLGAYSVEKGLVKSFKKNNIDEKSQVDSICIWLDNIIGKYKALCELIVKTAPSNPSGGEHVEGFELETKFSRILEWFHGSFETVEGNEWLEEDITKLLNGYGYGFAKYTDQNEGWFNKSLGDVEEPITSVPALINLKTQKCLIKGHTIMPR